MDIQTIWSLTGSIIASVGGAGVIICATSSFLSNKIANHIELNYEHRLNKEFEQYKSKLESKRYVTRTQFDSEFEIYRSLSKAFFTMLLKLSQSSFLHFFPNCSTLGTNAFIKIGRAHV